MKGYKCTQGSTISGKKKEPKPKLFAPDVFGWGEGLPSEGVGAKKLGMSLETQGKQTLWQDSPGFWAGYPGPGANSSLMGLLAKGFLKFCGNSAESSRKIRFIASGKGVEILRKVCGNFTAICGKCSAMTPSGTTP